MTEEIRFKQIIPAEPGYRAAIVLPHSTEICGGGPDEETRIVTHCLGSEHAVYSPIVAWALLDQGSEVVPLWFDRDGDFPHLTHPYDRQSFIHTLITPTGSELSWSQVKEIATNRLRCEAAGHTWLSPQEFPLASGY